MKENDTSIKSWAEDDRPREKLLSKGKSALSDAELIAIIINSGNSEESAVDLAKHILKESKDCLADLSKLSIKELTKFKGIGEAKAISIVAALELGKRRREEEVRVKPFIKTSKDVFDIFHPDMCDKNYEEFWILLLNKANKILGKYQISEGGIAGTVVDPIKIFRKAIENNAVGIILCHNHPSGNVKPSEADNNLTRKLKEGGKLIEITIHDHVIVGETGFFSYADEGLL